MRILTSINGLVIGILLTLLWGCRPAGDGTIVDLPTRLCVRTQHHGVPLQDIALKIRYQVDTFPGYRHPDEWFDTIIVTGTNARACLEPLPEGRHWIVAQGVDDTAYPIEVFGNLPFEISLTRKPVLDTILYVSEQH
jgi:hypothetical protein